MPKRHRAPYSAEFRAQLVALARSGRTPEASGEGVRADSPGDPELGAAGRSRRGPSTRRSDESGTRGASPAPRGGEEPQDRTGDLGLSSGLVRTGGRLDPTEGFELVKAPQAQLPVTRLCAVLELSTSGYYAGLNRELSARARAATKLCECIGAIHGASRGSCGVPRVPAELLVRFKRTWLRAVDAREMCLDSPRVRGRSRGTTSSDPRPAAHRSLVGAGGLNR
jgi:hypothetical protein